MHAGVSMTDLLQDADWTDRLNQSYIFLGVLESFGLCHFVFLQSKTIQDKTDCISENTETYTRARRTHAHTHARVFFFAKTVVYLNLFSPQCSSKIGELFIFFYRAFLCLFNLSLFFLNIFFIPTLSFWGKPGWSGSRKENKLKKLTPGALSMPLKLFST